MVRHRRPAFTVRRSRRRRAPIRLQMAEGLYLNMRDFEEWCVSVGETYFSHNVNPCSTGWRLAIFTVWQSGKLGFLRLTGTFRVGPKVADLQKAYSGFIWGGKAWGRGTSRNRNRKMRLIQTYLTSQTHRFHPTGKNVTACRPNRFVAKKSESASHSKILVVRRRIAVKFVIFESGRRSTSNSGEDSVKFLWEICEISTFSEEPWYKAFPSSSV
jgi:hypothetical protein